MGWYELRAQMMSEGGGKKMATDWGIKVSLSKSDMMEIFGHESVTLTKSNPSTYIYTGAPNTASPYTPVWTTIVTDNTDAQPWIDHGTNGTWQGSETVIDPGTVIYDDPPIQVPPGTTVPIPQWAPALDTWTPIVDPECDHDDLIDDMVEMQEQWIGAIDALKKKADDLAKLVELLFNKVNSDKFNHAELDDLATVARIKALQILGAKLTEDQGVKLVKGSLKAAHGTATDYASVEDGYVLIP